MFWFSLSRWKTTVNLKQTTAGIEKHVTAHEAVMDQKAEKEDVKQLEEKVKKLEETVSEKFTKLEGEESKTSELIDKKIEEKICEKKIEVNKPTTSVQDAVEEVKEQERRKCNVVLFNVTESDSVDTETRRQHDVEVVQELMKEEIMKTAEIKTDTRGMKMVTRLGKQGGQQSETIENHIHIGRGSEDDSLEC